MPQQKVLVGLLIATGFLAGCVSTTKQEKFKTELKEQTGVVEQQLKNVARVQTAEEERNEQEVAHPYLISKSVPVAREVSLPRAFQKGIKTTLLFAESRVSLAKAAERISLATGIPVILTPDVNLPDDQLLPRSSKQATPIAMPIAMQPVTNPSQLPPLTAVGGIPTASASASGDSVSSFDMPKVDAPLDQILDLIAAKLSIRWNYDDARKVIKFYRLETKTWSTPLSPADVSFTTAFDQSMQQSTNSSALAVKNGTSVVKAESGKLNELDFLTKSVESIMTRAGSIHFNAASGMITLTDTAEVVELANRIIESEIASMRKTVTLKVRAVQVKLSDKVQEGFDLNAAISAALNKMPNMSLSLTAPATLASTSAGGLAFNVVSGNAAGTSAILKALDQVGDVYAGTEISLPTRNRRPVNYNVTRTFSYVASTTPAAASITGGGGTPGITTAQDQVGLKVMFYPLITAKDTAMVTIALEQSVLDNIEPFSSGSGANVQTVQLPNKSAENSVGEIPIRHGQTIVLTGLDKNVNQFDKRALGAGVPSVLGGSKSLSNERLTTVLLISAFINNND